VAIKDRFASCSLTSPSVDALCRVLRLKLVPMLPAEPAPEPKKRGKD
jgi:hypothetical protein